MEAKRLSVQGSQAAYPVVIGPGLLQENLPQFAAQGRFSSIVIVTNQTIAPLYGHALQACIPGSTLITVPDGEQHKTLETVRTIYDGLLDHGADRATLVVALGGGVIGDMAGFAAATYMRGVPLVQAPTSLLAMVDASIGGKVGVDLPQGKNLVGVFKDPLAVFADTATLRTLPEVEVQCGMAEIIKAALIGDSRLLALLESGSADLDTLIKQAAAVKIAVVEQDRLEKGQRMYLNLGHTFGHALEQVSGYTWKHGHAVSVGLAAAVRLSARLGLCDAGLVGEVESLLVQRGLPIRYRHYAPQALWDAMRHDKKWRGGSPYFVLLRGAGQPVVQSGVDQPAVLGILAELREM